MPFFRKFKRRPPFLVGKRVFAGNTKKASEFFGKIQCEKINNYYYHNKKTKNYCILEIVI